ncbi:hypothetical protein EVAR_78839_1 [Eumeta japonica]|uniref:Uncharacterized protein n=1 Tax=Eumeta variegata TaxID=151549 RepID=A0A4C1SQV1_EUMVA|nr:hypothetical protein EVAR_78839_1 [Eumeta japonica]
MRYLDVGNYTTIKQTRESDLVSCHNKTEASRVTVTDSPKSETKLPRSIGQSARAVDTCHSPGLPFHVATCYIRIRFSSASIYADADADVEIDADVPHVRMRMRIFATSLLWTPKRCCYSPTSSQHSCASPVITVSFRMMK